MGFVFSGNTLGLLFSPFLAGIIYDYLGYYAVFIVLFGVIAFDIAMRGFMIEKRTADKWLEKETNANNNAADEDTRQTDDSLSARHPFRADHFCSAHAFLETLLILKYVGVGLNLILPPLLADLFYEVDILTEIHSDTFGKGGAYAQAYSLMCAALGAGTAFGPIWAGVFYQETNWPITMATLAVLTSLPAVGVYRYTGGSVKEEKPGRPEPGGRA
ncbi:MAG: hypothetical protein LQ343_004427 [Gyalolechia ehrenbergii]|nr:MAG: hypothetical protein LQ343_004427 [Gyalolechia ehrenbergii]